MQLDNIRVSRKLWGMFLVLMVIMLVISGFQQYRANSSMAQAIEEVISIEGRVTEAVRWRGATETAVTMLMGAAVTTDAVLAQQFDAKVKEIIGNINKVQERVVAQTTDPQEKAVLDQVLAERKAVLAATAKTWELKGAGDAVETQRFADDELTPLVAKYLKAQEAFVDVLQKRREVVVAEAQGRRTRYAVEGLMASALLMVVVLSLAWKLVRSITVPLDQASAMIDAIAAGDLTQELRSERKDEFGHMLRALSRMAERLRGVVGEVRTGVEAVSLASSEIATGNQDLSARTEQTASNLEQTAASMEELTATVTQSADTARQANQLAANAAQAATRGGQVVGQVVASMEQITHSSRKISDIISVIDGIAFQTNILALNAAVEAARAGEQGRGFAVVASEVRSLAGRSAEAAKEIKQLITDSVGRVEQGSALVDQAGHTMQEVVASIRRVTDIMGEISAASAEQSQGVSQVGEAVTQMDHATQQNAALVEEMAAAATSLKGQAQELVQAVSVFKLAAGQAAAPAQRASRTPVAAPFSTPRQPAPRSPQPASAPVASSASAKRLASGASKPTATAARAHAAPAPAPSNRTSTAAAAPASPTPAPGPAPSSASNDDWESF